jgi:beta-lactam-binding protein with PASTA domain
MRAGTSSLKQPIEGIRMADEYAVQPDEEQKDTKSRRQIIGLLLLIALIILIILWILSRIAVVPDVVGMTESQARMTVEDAGFDVGEVMIDGAALRDPGLIDDQGLAAGRWALKGRPIDLLIAAESKDTDDDPDARDIFSDFESDNSSIRDRGAAGSESALQPPRTYVGVPRVLNMTQAEAVRTLSAAGLTARIEYAPNAGGIAEGRVFYQMPAPNDDPTGSSVEVWISTGPPDFGTPYREPNKP